MGTTEFCLFVLDSWHCFVICNIRKSRERKYLEKKILENLEKIQNPCPSKKVMDNKVIVFFNNDFGYKSPVFVSFKIICSTHFQDFFLQYFFSARN